MARVLPKFAAPVLLALVCGAAAAQTTSAQNASSFVEALGVEQVRDDSSNVNGAASSQALWSGNIANRAQTAARSRSVEIAANARVFQDTGFTIAAYDLTLSQATYTLHAQGALAPRNASIDFFLPPSYLEIVSNAETAFHRLEAVMFAELRVCFAVACGEADRQFYFLAQLDAGYTSHSHLVQAAGNPALDLSPLLGASLVDSGAGNFTRTRLIEFPGFSGHFDLGLVAARMPITIEYLLQARASGTVAFSSAIAAINDPFFLDTDPVTAGTPVLLNITPAVPEPPALALLAAGALLLLSTLPRIRRRATTRP